MKDESGVRERQAPRHYGRPRLTEPLLLNRLPVDTRRAWLPVQTKKAVVHAVNGLITAKKYENWLKEFISPSYRPPEKTRI